MQNTVKVTVKRSPAKHAERHKPAASATLMRQAVHKPGPSLKRRVKAIGAAEYGHPVQVIKPAPKPVLLRQHKSYRDTPKSPLIKHYSDVHHVHPSKRSAQTKHPISASTQTHSPSLNKTSSVSHNKTYELITSPSFELNDLIPQPRPSKRTKKKYVNKIWLACLILFMLVFYLASQKFVSSETRPAAIKSTVSVQLPQGLPTSYKLIKTTENNGQLNAYFAAKTAPDKVYSLSEKSSLLDPSQLLSSYLLPVYPHPTTSVANGLTVYFYGNGDATWVKNGIWYTIESNGNLNQSQLQHIADSTL